VASSTPPTQLKVVSNVAIGYNIVAECPEAWGRRHHRAGRVDR
jgi:hypothetical protein